LQGKVVPSDFSRVKLCLY